MKTEFNLNKDYSVGSQWQQKAFASKLKQIVSILTGIPVEDLEKQEVKDRVLEEEWWYWCVFKTSQRVSYLENTDFDKTGLSVTLIKPTVRQFLQEIGTEAMRDNIHPNVWCNALMSEYKPRQATIINNNCPRQGIYDVTEEDELIYGTIGNYPNWCITDVRFPNELKAIENREGISIRVNRPTVYATPKDNSEYNNQELVMFNHPSETSLDSATFDYVVNNDSDIQSLIEKIKIILINENIL